MMIWKPTVFSFGLIKFFYSLNFQKFVASSKSFNTYDSRHKLLLCHLFHTWTPQFESEIHRHSDALLNVPTIYVSDRKFSVKIKRRNEVKIWYNSVLPVADGLLTWYLLLSFYRIIHRHIYRIFVFMCIGSTNRL